MSPLTAYRAQASLGGSKRAYLIDLVILEHITRSGPAGCSLEALCCVTSTSLANICKVITRMSKGGLVACQRIPGDSSREKFCTLTEKGSKFWEQANRLL